MEGRVERLAEVGHAEMLGVRARVVASPRDGLERAEPRGAPAMATAAASVLAVFLRSALVHIFGFIGEF